jgi:hypothetical protein
MRGITTAFAIALLLVWSVNRAVATEVRSTNDFIKVCDEAVPCALPDRRGSPGMGQ